MEFKYMVKGKVESGFILRGHYNAVGTNVSIMVHDNELDFVKSRCSGVVVESVGETTANHSEPVLKEQTIEPKEVENNDLQQKPNGRANKSKHKD